MALYCRNTRITSPYEYMLALTENAAMNGVKFAMDHEIIDIQRVYDETHITSSGTDNYLFWFEQVMMSLFA